MGVALDLLEQARHLASYRAPSSTQSDLRRAVSTAYYALFHLLVEEGGARWLGGSPAAETGLQRAFDHGPMKQVSIRFKETIWTNWRGAAQPVPPALRQVATAFVDLQEDRHLADYDNHQQWSDTDVKAVLQTAERAFRDWDSIRTQPIAGDYLLAMLLGKRR